MNLYKSYDYKNVSKEDFIAYEKIRNPDYSYAIRRYEQNSSQIKLLHYDNLIDFTENLIGESTY